MKTFGKEKKEKKLYKDSPGMVAVVFFDSSDLEYVPGCTCKVHESPRHIRRALERSSPVMDGAARQQNVFLART